MRVDGRYEYATCGRGNFLNPERKSCGFKNIRIRVDGALVSSMKRTLVETLGKGSLRRLNTVIFP